MNEKPLEELENELQALQEEREEIEELRDMVLGQEGVHLSGGNAKKYAALLADIEEQILKTQQLIKEKQQ